MAMRYGAYGREDNSLVIIHGATGAMTIKILKRLFDFENVNSRIGAAAEQETPIQVVALANGLMLGLRIASFLGSEEDQALCGTNTEGKGLRLPDAQRLSKRPLQVAVRDSTSLREDPD